MARRILFFLGALLVQAAPASDGDIYHHKRAIDERLSSMHTQIATANAREGTLSAQISVANAKINALADDVGQAQTLLACSKRSLRRHNVYSKRRSSLSSKRGDCTR